MNKAVSAGIGVGLGLVALAVILLSSGETDPGQDKSSTGVEMSDEVEVTVEESKSYDVNLSEDLEVGDGNP